MTPRRNLAASVKQRLLNLARQRGEDFNLVLTRFGIERLLFRLSRSDHERDFVLKGAMLFHLWAEKPHRPTRDVDLLGRGTPDLRRLEAVFRDVCRTAVDDDGLRFLPSTVHGERIRDDAEYLGIRVRLEARLGNARIRLQVDVGFGDVVVPLPELVEFPTLLDHPAPRLTAYRRETVVAEKLQAMVELGFANTRMKDFFDLMFIAESFEFDGRELARAIDATFARRRCPIPTDAPTALTEAFAADVVKKTQWSAFMKRVRVQNDEVGIGDVVDRLRRFLLPPLESLSSGDVFEMLWTAGGPWTSIG